MNLPTKITVLRLILTVFIILLIYIPFSLFGISFPKYDINLSIEKFPPVTILFPGYTVLIIVTISFIHNNTYLAIKAKIQKTVIDIII